MTCTIITLLFTWGLPLQTPTPAQPLSKPVSLHELVLPEATNQQLVLYLSLPTAGPFRQQEGRMELLLNPAGSHRLQMEIEEIPEWERMAFPQANPMEFEINYTIELNGLFRNR